MEWKRMLLANASVLALVAIPATGAGGVVHIATDIDANGLEQVFEAGDLVPVNFYVSGDGDAGVFGVDFEIQCNTDDVRIASVTFAPAFPVELGRHRADLPASQFHTVRV